MHNWAKEIMECVKAKVTGMGIDNITGCDLEELKTWSCIAKDIAEYDYYYHITEAMEKPENEYGVNYDENGRFYTPMRNSRGQYMSRGRRGYSHEVYDPDEYYRDMDYDNGRMYYTETGNMGNMDGMNRGYSRYDMAKRGYEESKKMNPNDDTENMDKMEELFKAFEEDIKELKPKMTQTEKNFGRTKLTSLASMM